MNEWLNPWMLYALVAMAIPMVIEWLFRRRRQQIPFPAMRYLMKSKKRRRVRLQDLILLLIRTVVPGVLAIALARPLFRPEEGSGTASAPRHVVITLDATYSMGQSIGQTTAFALAQAMGQEIVRALPKDALVSLILLGKRPEIIKTATADHESVQDALSRASVSDQAGRIGDAVEAVEKLMKSLGERGEFYFISDLQHSTWASTPEDTRAAAPLLKQLQHYGEAFVLDTGGTNAFNAFITNFGPREPVLVVGMVQRFEVELEVRNMPTQGKLWLTLFADEDKDQDTARERKSGKLLTRELAVSDFEGGRTKVVFPHTFLHPGDHQLRVEVEGDSLALDNRRYYLARVPDQVGVLVIDPKHESAVGSDPLASNSGHLRHAIAPPTPAGFERIAPFSVTVCRPEEVLQHNLENYAVIILANVGFPGETLISRLEQYVADGGGLLIFAGEDVAPYEYNARLYKKGKGLLPGELEPAITVMEAGNGVEGKKEMEKLLGISFASRSGDLHPSVANVRHLTRQASPPSIRRHMPIKVRTQEGEWGNPVAYLTDGKPLIVEKPFGQGKVLIVGTSPDSRWNYLVYTSEYVILVQELLRWMIGHPDRGVNLRFGQTFQQPVLLSSQYLLLRRPDFAKVRVAPVPKDNLWLFSYNQTDRQGIYEVDTTAEVMPRRRFAVNLESTEGDLTRIDLSAFKDELGRSGVTYWGPERAVSRAVQSRYSVQEYAWLLLAFLLALLAGETLLATRFGRRRM